VKEARGKNADWLVLFALKGIRGDLPCFVWVLRGVSLPPTCPNTSLLPSSLTFSRLRLDSRGGFCPEKLAFSPKPDLSTCFSSSGALCTILFDMSLAPKLFATASGSDSDSEGSESDSFQFSIHPTNLEAKLFFCGCLCLRLFPCYKKKGNETSAIRIQ
jgi:hypothetical protein